MTVAIVTNGGTPGALYVADAAEALTFTIDSSANIRSAQWAIVGTDETSGSYTLTPSGLGNSTCATTAGALGTAFVVQVTVNGGVAADGTINYAETRSTAKVAVPTAAGKIVLCVGETTEDDPTYGWIPRINDILRTGTFSGQSATFVPLVDATDQTAGFEIMARAYFDASAVEAPGAQLLLHVSSGLTFEAHLYSYALDGSDGQLVPDSTITDTDTSPTLFELEDLVLPQEPRMYQVRLKISAGSPGEDDRAYFSWGRLGAF